MLNLIHYFMIESISGDEQKLLEYKMELSQPLPWESVDDVGNDAEDMELFKRGIG